MANYNFSYLDAQLDALITQGVEPFLSFDYMLYVLALVQNTTNSANEFKAQGAEYSFSNGIRTSPPSDPAVYARVIRNMIRHVIGKFPAGGRDYGVKYFEIGNEPEFTFFWGGTRQQWITMYNAIASEVILDADLAAIKLGGGSFALPVSEILDEQNMINNTFLRDFIEDVNTNSTRLDFLSYHSYNNNAQFHADAMSYVNTLLAAYSPSTEIINGEWGLDLNNGLDVIYETIEHGLFRSKVVMSMQIFGPTYAHESLLRDPYTSSCTTGQLGLIQTGPPKGKPAYDVYRGLNLINNTLVGLPIVNTAGTYVMAGKDQTDSKVVIIFIAEDPGSPRNVNLTVNNIPWAGGTVSRYEVSEATHAAQQGVAQMDNAIIVGSNYAKQVSYDKPQLMIWELIKP